MLKHDIQLAIVLDTHCRPGKEPKMLVGGPGPKQAKRVAKRWWLTFQHQSRTSCRTFVPTGTNVPQVR